MSIGIKFPFEDSPKGFFLSLNETSKEQVKSNLLHLLLTRKSERLFLPEFGTNLLGFIFDQNDEITYEQVRSSIQESVSKFLPNITINSIDVSLDEPSSDSDNTEIDQTIFDKQGSTITKTRITGNINTDSAQAGHAIQVKIDFTVKEGSFESSDSLIIKF